MDKAYLAKLTRWGGHIVVVIALGLPMFAAQAGEITQKGRDTYHCADDKFVEVGDVSDHWIGVYKCEGISSTVGGETGIFMLLGTGDYIAGRGPEQGYYTITYDDGSAVHGKWEGILAPDEGGKTSTGTGTYQIISGTNRLAGIKGSGNYTCKSYGDKGYCDWTETYTLP